jgi:hypothetical protein
MSKTLLRALAQAYAEQRVDRRTYIRERRRLIDEAVAGIESAPPAVLEPARSSLDPTDVTIQLQREVADEFQEPSP